MRIHRIYTSQSLHCGDTIALEEQPSNHLGKVLRSQVGQAIILFNGKGGEFTAVITEISKKMVSVNIQNFTDKNIESPCETHIAVAISKGDKMELIVQKATELGASSITPLLSEHCDIKFKAERFEKKQQQWQKIAIQACEQSGRNTIPLIHHPIRFDQYLQQKFEGERCLFHPQGNQTISELPPFPSKLDLCFGSEGGFSQREVDNAKLAGLHIIQLGQRVLRAETAPIAILGAINSLWGDWR